MNTPRISLRKLSLGLALGCTVAIAAAPARAAELTLDIGPITRAQGTVQIAVYASEAEFRKTMLRALREPARTGRLRVTVPGLPAGEYAVMVFHDLDGNDRLDTNLLGIPREPWGGSLRGKSVFGPPGWADVKFTLPAGGETLAIEMSP